MCNILAKQFKSVFTDDKHDSFSETRPHGPSHPLSAHQGRGCPEAICWYRPQQGKWARDVLRELATELAPVSTCLFWQSLLTGDLITQSWLTAWIASVFKKGPQCKHGNCRPVSLTCVMCKLMEHIICTHICSHLDRHGILSDLNHGFWSRHSCESQLLITTHDFLARMDQREEVGVLVLDFSKVFDTGQHKRLLKKFYGIHGELLSRIRAFLSTRTQSVEVKGCHSPEDKVLPAVPQGTVLGPLLFLCHINDLPSIVNPQMAVRLFVDDCLVYRSITSSSDHRQLQPDLPALSHWGLMLADEVQCG